MKWISNKQVKMVVHPNNSAMPFGVKLYNFLFFTGMAVFL